MAVNLSPKQLLQPGLDSQLLQACRRHGIAPRMLELERTESALVHNMDVIKLMLHRLRGHGFSLALDDFGTGCSSLSWLRHLPFDKIKIDRSFVMDIERDPAAVRLLDSIVRLCQVLGMHTVAECVEPPPANGRTGRDGRQRVPGRPLFTVDTGRRLAAAVAGCRWPATDPAAGAARGLGAGPSDGGAPGLSQIGPVPCYRNPAASACVCDSRCACTPARPTPEPKVP